jgi:hypothetical protein
LSITGSLAVVAASLLAAAAREGPAGVHGAGLFRLGDASGLAEAAGVTPQAGVAAPRWADLFDASGWARDSYPADAASRRFGNGVPDYRELFGGLNVAFTADNEDARPGFEPSARGANHRLVVNGAAAPARDIETLMGYVTEDAAGNQFVFVAASRLAKGPATLELELNQSFVRVGRGGYGRSVPWTVVGWPNLGDLRLRLELDEFGISSATLRVLAAGEDGALRWDDLESFAGQGCGDRAGFCAVANLREIDGAPWDAAGRRYESGTFVEAAFDISSLLGARRLFATLQARTEDDLAFAYFGSEGR